MFKKIFRPLPLAIGLALAVIGLPAPAVELPKVVRIIVPASPGASTDLLARALGLELSQRTGRTFIVENRPGASTMLGSASVAKGPKDGSMLLINSTSLMSSGASMKNPPLDVQRDLVPLALLAKNPLVVAVSMQSDIKTPADMLKAARDNELSHGTAGVGSIAHYAQEFISEATGAHFNHVPYKGTSAAVSDLSGGIIDTVIGTWSSVAPGVNAGRARAVAVTSLEKNPAFPNLPAMSASVPGYSIDLWVGMFGPTGMAPELVQYLNQEINAASKSAKLREFYAVDGAQPLSLSPEQISQLMKSDYDRFKKLAQSRQISIN